MHRTHLLGIFAVSGLLLAGQELPDNSVDTDTFDVATLASGDNCTFKASPESFLDMSFRARKALFDRISIFEKGGGYNRDATNSTQPATVNPRSVSRKNFIDDEIFDKLIQSNVNAASMSTDEEFLRRITLDLTGRIPSSADVRAFVADANPAKRSAMIDKLLYSPEFNDKWTMWLGDLVQNSSALPLAQGRGASGRNAFYQGLYNFVAGYRSIKDLTVQLITATGNNYDPPGFSNWALDGLTTGGPANDNYDMQAVMAAKQFLGLGNYDCLMCHNGRGHLDQLNVWATGINRTDAENMAAFFSRTTKTNYQFPPGTSIADQNANPYNQSQIVNDATTFTSAYALPTTFGNRPNRTLINGKNTADMIYRTGQRAATNANPRQQFANYLVNDPMFSVNFANRIFKQMFNYGLVDTVEFLDPARLDPANPPDPSWGFQATHPVLLQRLAKFFVQTNYNLRETLRVIAESSAYQLSSRYSDEWDITMIPLFARHYPRRLDGEEVHDSIVKSTGVRPSYTIGGIGYTNPNPISFAMQAPDTITISNTILNAFLRGDRDATARSQAVTIQQSLALMNDSFVTTRTKIAQPGLQAIQKLTTPTAQVEELYLTFLGRMPSPIERNIATNLLTAATTTAAKNAAIEDLSWALINKLEFAYSY